MILQLDKAYISHSEISHWTKIMHVMGSSYTRTILVHEFQWFHYIVMEKLPYAIIHVLSFSMNSQVQTAGITKLGLI